MDCSFTIHVCIYVDYVRTYVATFVPDSKHNIFSKITKQEHKYTMHVTGLKELVKQ